MKNTALFICLLAFAGLKGQSLKFDWAKSIGDTSPEVVRSSKIDLNGNIYITGFFYGKTDFDPGPDTAYLSSNSFYSWNMYVVKLDKYGDFVWARASQLSEDVLANSRGHDLIINSLGEVHVFGVFRDSVDFDPGPATHYLTAQYGGSFILKLDSMGNFISAQTHGGAVVATTVDKGENMYATGTFNLTADFDPGPGLFNLSSGGLPEVFILKLDPAGNFVWVRRIRGDQGESVGSIATDLNDNVYVAGTFRGTLEVNPGWAAYDLTSRGNFDSFVLKLDKDKNFIWAKSIGSPQADRCYALAVDYRENVYLGGVFEGRIDMDPDTSHAYSSSMGRNDAYLVRLDKQGNYSWGKTMGGSGVDVGLDLAVDKVGGVYNTGWFEGFVDFDLSSSGGVLISKGRTDAFLIKHDSLGNLLWSGAVGDTGYDYIHALNIDQYNNVHLAGEYVASADVDPSKKQQILSAIGNGRALFVIKLNPCGANTRITVNDPTIISKAIGAKYQWLDCDNNYASLPGDTMQTFMAAANGNYTVMITQAGCTDTSDCVNIAQVSLAEGYELDDITLFPNPSDGVLNIELGDIKEAKIDIFDSSGRLIYSDLLDENSKGTIPLNTASGLYLVKISAEGKTRNFKLMIN